MTPYTKDYTKAYHLTSGGILAVALLIAALVLLLG